MASLPSESTAETSPDPAALTKSLSASAGSFLTSSPRLYIPARRTMPGAEPFETAALSQLTPFAGS